MNTLSYLHNCNVGDLTGALAGMRQAYQDYGKKAIIYQQLDVPGQYYEGAIHSVKDDHGVQVTMNRKMFDMMRPLLLAQEYVEDFIVWNVEEPPKIDIDLTVIRGKVDVNIPYGALPSWTLLAYPPMACDLSQPWITVPDGDDDLEGVILINRTQRYLRPKIKYGFLKDYRDDILFIGTEKEHALFCNEHNLNLPRLEVDNFLDLAQVMKKCRFMVGNQSFPWNLANAMGVPRILEMCSFAPNCQPFYGPNNYGFLHQVPLQFYFDLLYKKTGSSEKVAC